MPLITWENSYSVGVEKIDTQHKKLIDLINQLHDALTVGKGREVLAGVLNGVADYTKMHFSTEEDLMRTHQYTGFAEHKKIHDDLIKQVGDLQAKAKSGGMFLSTDVMKFLQSWLAHHISNIDKKLGAYLNEKGVR